MRQHKIFWTGCLIYAASFALFGVADSWPRSAPLRGYQCAIWAFLVPLHNTSEVHVQPRDFFIFASGWINVFFLGFLILTPFKRFERLMRILRVIVLLMIPFPWVAFYYGPFYPREGYFLWVLGMLLVVFSASAAMKPHKVD